MNYLEQVPDSAKVAASVAAPVLTIFGVSVEQWGYVISAIVGILFIIEKIPVAAKAVGTIMNWWKTRGTRKR